MNLTRTLKTFIQNRNSKIPNQKSVDPVSAWVFGDDAPSAPALHNAFEQSAWVYRATTAIAEQVANVPFRFSRGHTGAESIITSGPLVEFYNRPNPFLNRFQYWELRVLWLLLRGECFRIPIYSEEVGTSSTSSHSPALGKRSTLKSVVFLDPARMRHVVEGHQLVGWRYTGLSSNDPLHSQVFLPEEVWFERLPNPFDLWRGLAPLSAAHLPARADFAAASYMRGFIENNAESGLIVRADQQLSGDQREQIASALRDRKRRSGAPDRTILLWGAAEIIHPQLSSADLQFLENRKFCRAEICAAFGIPEEIVSSTDHNKYDVMQGARLNFIENRIAPLCARLAAEEQTLVRSLDPQAVGWFDLDSLPIMQQARRDRLTTAKIGFDMGIPFNELNRVLDLGFKTLPHGQNCYLPATLQNAGHLPEA